MTHIAIEEPKERSIPNVIVKLWPGKPERQKARLCDAMVKDVADAPGCGGTSVSMQEVAPGDWTGQVYKPGIRDRWNTFYETPGGDPLS